MLFIYIFFILANHALVRTSNKQWNCSFCRFSSPFPCQNEIFLLSFSLPKKFPSIFFLVDIYIYIYIYTPHYHPPLCQFVCIINVTIPPTPRFHYSSMSQISLCNTVILPSSSLSLSEDLLATPRHTFSEDMLQKICPHLLKSRLVMLFSNIILVNNVV